MLKHLKILLSFIKNNLIREMEFRGHFIMDVFISIFYISLQLITIEVYFQFTDDILGWTKYELFALVGIVRVTKGLFDTFSRSNLLTFPKAVSRGELDYSLTRPIDSQFILSFRRHNLSEFSGILSGLAILIYFFVSSGFQLTFINSTVLIMGIALGFLAYYSIFFAFTTLAIFTTRLTAMKEMQDVFSQTMRYPTEIYSRNNKFYEFLLVPILIIATLPAKLFLAKLPSWLILVEFLTCVLLVVVSRKFWLFAIRHYSSASS